MFFILLGCSISSVAQKNNAIKPKWVGNTPVSSKAGYYFIPVHSDVSRSLDAARAAVKQEIASNVERTDKVTVYEVFDDNSVQKYDQNGNVTMNSTDSYQLNLKVEGSARPIKSRRIDEYWETVDRGGQTVLDYYALYAVERNGMNADFSGISSVSSYGAHGLWRSAIIPGWGQFYKGSTLKGSLILGGTAVLVGATIYTDCMRADYAKKILKTHITENKRVYATRRDNFAMGRNICIGALGALYIYNIVDAIVAPGARHIVINKNAKGAGYALLPSITTEGCPALYAEFSF